MKELHVKIVSKHSKEIISERNIELELLDLILKAKCLSVNGIQYQLVSFTPSVDDISTLSVIKL